MTQPATTPNLRLWAVVVAVVAVFCLGRWMMEGAGTGPGQAPPVEDAATAGSSAPLVYCTGSDHLVAETELESRARALRAEIETLRPVSGELHDDYLRRAGDYLSRVAELHLDALESNPGLVWWPTHNLDRSIAVDAAVSIKRAPVPTDGED